MSSRPSGFTDAELAAAAWKRNMKLQASLRKAEEDARLFGRRRKDVHKADRKKKKRVRSSSGKIEKKRKDKRGSTAKSGRRGQRRARGRSRSTSLGSVDSLGRERKRTRSRSADNTRLRGAVGDPDRSPGYRRSLQKKKRAREHARGEHRVSATAAATGRDTSASIEALGWRGMMARRGPSASPLRSRSSSSSSSGRSFGSAVSGGSGINSISGGSSSSSSSSNRDSDGYSFKDEVLSRSINNPGRDWLEGHTGIDSGAQGKLAMLDPNDQVPADPKRPDHDDRVERWRGGWRSSGIDMGTMAMGRGSVRGPGGREWRGQDNRDSADSDDDRGRRGTHGRRRRSRSRTSGAALGEKSVGSRSSSRSSSRNRSSRRSGGKSRSRSRSRSRSPSYERSPSGDRESVDLGKSSVVSRLIEEYSRRQQPPPPPPRPSTSNGSFAATAAAAIRIYGPGAAGDDDSSDVEPKRRRHQKRQLRGDDVPTWTHDLFEETAGDSPPRRTTLPPDYKPEQPTWVSRAGGVYVPMKPSGT